MIDYTQLDDKQLARLKKFFSNHINELKRRLESIDAVILDRESSKQKDYRQRQANDS